VHAIIYPDPRITPATINAADSSYTQAGPRPGQPDPQGDTVATVEASGSLASASVVEIKSQRGGLPSSALGAATLVWRSAASGPYYGLDAPWVVRGWEWLIRRANGGSDADSRPFVAATPTGKVLCVSHRATASAQRVDVRTLTPGTGWGAAVVASSGSEIPTQSHPALLVLPSGRVLLYHWVVTAQYAHLRIRATDDEGATWTTLAARSGVGISTDATTGYTLGRIRAAYSAGEVLVVCSLIDNASGNYVLHQFASDSLGYALHSVGVGNQATVAERGRSAEVLPIAGGGFRLVYYYPADAYFVHRSIPTAWRIYHQGTDREEVPVPSFTKGSPDYAAAWVGADSTMWFATSINASPYQILLAWSRDQGETWYHQRAGPYVTLSDVDLEVSTPTACEVRGLVVWVSKFATTTQTFDNDSLVAWYSGGHTNVTWPTVLNEQPYQLQRALWFGQENPANFAGLWTRTAGGAPSEVVNSTGWEITTGVGATVRYDTAGAADITRISVFEGEIKVTSGGSVSSDQIAVRLVSANGVNDYTVTIRLTATQLRVVDNNGAATIATVSVDSSGGLWVRAMLRGASLSVWTAPGGVAAASSWTRLWTLAASSTTLVSSGAPAATGSIRWGQYDAGSAEVAEWRSVASRFISDDSGVISALLGNPEVVDAGAYASLTTLGADWPTTDLLGVRWAPAGVTLPPGVHVRLVDGPTAGRIDEWHIATAYDFGIERVHPRSHPSPRREWRATDDATPSVIAWDLATSDTVVAESELLGVFVERANWRTADIAGWNGAAWVTLGTLNLSAGLESLRYVRQGSAIVVDVANASPATAAWLHRGELAGATVDLGSGAIRRVGRSSSGRWTRENTLRPVLFLDGVTDTEPASGTCNIWRPSGAVLIPTNGTPYRRVRVTIAAADTVDGYHRAGVILLGPALPLGAPSWGRSLEVRPDVELVELDGGARASRVRGPSRRQVAVAWREGLPTVDLYDLTDLPDLLPDGGRAVAADTPSLLAGLLDELEGSHVPVVLVQATDSARRAMSAEAVIYGRITSSAAREVVLGDELSSEVQRVGELVLEAEL
jgi:hypothetical protein